MLVFVPISDRVADAASARDEDDDVIHAQHNLRFEDGALVEGVDHGQPDGASCFVHRDRQDKCRFGRLSGEELEKSMRRLQGKKVLGFDDRKIGLCRHRTRQVGLGYGAGLDEQFADSAALRALFGECNLKFLLGEHAEREEDLAQRIAILAG